MVWDSATKQTGCLRPATGECLCASLVEFNPGQTERRLRIRLECCLLMCLLVKALVSVCIKLCGQLC